MKAVFLTAGAAGMYCGSCMHDNSLAKAMRAQGVDCVLQPVYTPIRTDEESIASEHVFFRWSPHLSAAANALASLGPPIDAQGPRLGPRASHGHSTDA